MKCSYCADGHCPSCDMDYNAKIAELEAQRDAAANDAYAELGRAEIARGMATTMARKCDRLEAENKRLRDERDDWRKRLCFPLQNPSPITGGGEGEPHAEPQPGRLMGNTSLCQHGTMTTLCPDCARGEGEG